MPGPTIPAWVRSNPICNIYVNQFTAAEWVILEQNGFQNSLGNDLIAMSALMGLQMAKAANRGAPFELIARQVLTKINALAYTGAVAPDLGLIEGWLGNDLFQRTERELTNFQDMDDLATALTNPQVRQVLEGGSDLARACAPLGEHAGQDIRQLYRARRINLGQFLNYVKKVHEELSHLKNRAFPTWAAGIETKLIIHNMTPEQITLLGQLGLDQFTQTDLERNDVIQYIATVVRQVKVAGVANPEFGFEASARHAIELCRVMFAKDPIAELLAMYGIGSQAAVAVHENLGRAVDDVLERGRVVTPTEETAPAAASTALAQHSVFPQPKQAAGKPKEHRCSIM
ncbi:MAG: hypothetical protein NTW08_04550 [Gammaproteobacteria bacterium]|nr:hypothetical protein [Gammaproteobacteria bacterium]